MKPEVDQRDAFGQLIERCSDLLARVDEALAIWTQGEGLPIRGPVDVLVLTVFARSTRTYRGAVLLAEAGLGEQVRMLARSLFEDMVDAHWISLNGELAVERANDHRRYSQYRRLETTKTFPKRFPEPMPELDPPMTDEERARLKKLFRNGTGPWTGVSTADRWMAIAGLWEEGMEREQAEFFNAWLHKTSHETLHLSAYALRAGAPKQIDDDLVLRTGATPEQLGVGLFCVVWTYAQTVRLVSKEFQLKAWDRIYAEAIEPGYEAFASAGPVAAGFGM
jgi:hypothetical protein